MGQQPATDEVVWYVEGNAAPLAKGASLQAGQTYVAAVGGNAGLVSALHLWWDDATFGTSAVTFETSCRPDKGPNAAEIYDAAGAGQKWVSESSLGSTAVAAGAAGGRMFHLQSVGAKRTRVKVVCNGTGRAHAIPHSKD